MLAKPAVGKERGWGRSSYGRHRLGLRDGSVPLCPCSILRLEPGDGLEPVQPCELGSGCPGNG